MRHIFLAETVIVSHHLPPGLTVMFSRDQIPSVVFSNIVTRSNDGCGP